MPGGAGGGGAGGGGAGGGAGGAGGGAGGSGSSGGAGGAAAASTAAAAFVSSGDLRIQAPQEVAQSAQFEGAVQRALAYLANVGAGAVELIIGCLVGRRLTASSTIDVCFKVQSDSREVSEEICKRLSYVQRRDVQYAIASELLNSDVQPDQVHVVYYRANRNPEAPANPNLGRPTDPFTPGSGAINLG